MTEINENGDIIDSKRDILNEIARKTQDRIDIVKREIPLEILQEQARSMPCDTGFPFEKSLRACEMAFICEVKKASPSKGLIAPDYPYVDIAKAYENAGAAAISCLTEPFYFQGSDAHLMEIAQAVSTPILRKDFTVDAYMIYQAKVMGASAILLICAILDDIKLREFFEIATDLGLSVLIEAHTVEEVQRAVAVGGRIIGVNNRNLKNFQLSLQHSLNLRKFVPDNVIFVSESGIKAPHDIKVLHDHGTNAVLIGETLMRAQDKVAMLSQLCSELSINDAHRKQECKHV